MNQASQWNIFVSWEWMCSYSKTSLFSGKILVLDSSSAGPVPRNVPIFNCVNISPEKKKERRSGSREDIYSISVIY